MNRYVGTFKIMLSTECKETFNMKVKLSNSM